MDINHYNELITLSQEIYDLAAEKLSNYIAAKYSAVENSTTEQLEDYLFVTEETSAYFVGNALALLDADTQNTEIKTFTDNLRRIIKYAQQKTSKDIKPS